MALSLALVGRSRPGTPVNASKRQFQMAGGEWRHVQFG
jgi:hypothetical protein